MSTSVPFRQIFDNHPCWLLKYWSLCRLLIWNWKLVNLWLIWEDESNWRWTNEIITLKILSVDEPGKIKLGWATDLFYVCSQRAKPEIYLLSTCEFNILLWISILSFISGNWIVKNCVFQFIRNILIYSAVSIIAQIIMTVILNFINIILGSSPSGSENISLNLITVSVIPSEDYPDF